MKFKFEVGDVVRNKEFGEKQKITFRTKRRGKNFYSVVTLEGPGPYGGEETWTEDELLFVDDVEGLREYRKQRRKNERT